ncbi:MAG: type I DNA topoisomerase [Candidatus Latescibacteria bacterium]|nr:type I DNA topoisomerase [Candidatus Latescibacterota bacterium]
MAKSLVIVESPAKAKTINKFLGSDYIVKPTGGHIIDLPEKEIGIDIENGFEPRYIVIKGKKKILSDLKEAAGKAEAVLLATDPDREGEAIAWHVANRIVGENQPSYRVLINQITKNAVLEAVKNKGELDLKKVNAQQARRVLDRLVGYKVSPFLWKTMYSGLSAGRVQSVALRLVVERDAEIEAFVSEEYWSIDAVLSTAQKEVFKAKLINKNGKTLKIGNAEESASIADELKSQSYSVSDISKKKTKRQPYPPFITSTLQQDASRRLGFTVHRTMRVAQTLYEGVELSDGYAGLITYMRTDSTRIAPEAIEEAREYIMGEWGSDYLPSKPNIYRTKKGAQDAHEAIRPASMSRKPEDVKPFLSVEQFKLYRLIWNRFIASQMNPSESTVVTADIEAGVYGLRASASHLDFKGFLIVYEDLKPENGEPQESDLPKSLKKGDNLNLEELLPTQHFTKPPARFTEATLVKQLEAEGIGRPSTYAQIISTIQTREYVQREKGKLLSTELGRKVNNLLVNGFPNLFTVDFTANMEEELDKIESGEHMWLNVVNDFYGPFTVTLNEVSQQAQELKQSMIETTEEVCEKCGKPMIIRWGRNGKFMACSGFPKCKNTRPLEQVESEKSDDICDKCGSPMEIKNGRYGRFIACSNYPDCQNIKPFTLGVKCPIEGCDGDIVEKRSKKGRLFYGCSKYPKCKYASWTKPVAATCPTCGSPALTETKSDDSYSCPRCKSTFNKSDLEIE